MRVHQKCRVELAQVRKALDPARLLTSGAEDRQENQHQQRNNADDDEQLNERERFAVRYHSTHSAPLVCPTTEMPCYRNTSRQGMSAYAAEDGDVPALAQE